MEYRIIRSGRTAGRMTRLNRLLNRQLSDIVEEASRVYLSVAGRQLEGSLLSPDMGSIRRITIPEGHRLIGSRYGDGPGCDSWGRIHCHRDELQEFLYAVFNSRNTPDKLEERRKRMVS